MGLRHVAGLLFVCVAACGSELDRSTDRRETPDDVDVADTHTADLAEATPTITDARDEPDTDDASTDTDTDTDTAEPEVETKVETTDTLDDEGDTGTDVADTTTSTDEIPLDTTVTEDLQPDTATVDDTAVDATEPDVDDTGEDISLDTFEDTSPPDTVEDTTEDLVEDTFDDTLDSVEDLFDDTLEDTSELDTVTPDTAEPPAPIGTVTWTIRSGNDDGAEAPLGILYCLDADHCATPEEAFNWNDRDVRSVDVWHMPGNGLTLADIDRVEIRYPSADTWAVACVEVAVDGEVVHCARADVTLGFTLPAIAVWSAAPTLDCETCWDNTLTQGPVVGGTSDHTTRIWLRSDAGRSVALRLGPDEASARTATPLATTVLLAANDFTYTFVVDGLEPATTYYYTLDIDGRVYPDAGLPAYHFRTAPATGAPSAFSFGAGSCARSDPDKSPTQPTFTALENRHPDFFLFVGDNVYFDPTRNGDTVNFAGARAYYRDGPQRKFSWAVSPPVAWADYGRDARATFLAHTPTFAVWDDHDFLHDNSYGVIAGVPDPNRTWARQAFMEYMPNPSFGENGHGVYHRFAWGDVDVFMVDGRYFRDTNRSTMLGTAQRAWLFEGLRTSTATFKIVADGSDWSPESINDSWAGFPQERDALWTLISTWKIGGLIFISGDSHRSELRAIPGPDGGYTIPHIVSSALATVRRNCPQTNEFFEIADKASCYGADSGATPSFVILDVDTTRPDPSVTATIRDQFGNSQRAWTFQRSDLSFPPNRPELPRRAADFDGDGYADLAIGIPSEDVNAADDGQVQVIYGSTAGLHSQGHRAYSQLGFSGSNEAGDQFGAALAHGDFNDDGYDELVIGIPGEDHDGSGAGSGRVAVLRGYATGLRVMDEAYREGAGGISGIASGGHRFGAALAVGDFDADGFDDLAIGIPGLSGGAVQILMGGLGPLVAGPRLDQTNTGVFSADELGDAFGAVLTTGDFDGDGYDDLAIGAPTEDRPGADDAGYVTIVRGGPAGLVGGDDRELGAEEAGLVVRSDMRWGSALVAADLDGDSVDDLAVGAPGTSSNTGLVAVFPGFPGEGLTVVGTSVVYGDLVPGATGISDDVFGATLAAADFDGDGVADLAIGVPGRATARGHVLVRFATNVTKLLNQDFTNWTVAAANDRFGAALAIGDYNGDGFADLAVGVPGDVAGVVMGAGGVDVVYGHAASAGAFDAPHPLLGVRQTQRWNQTLNALGAGGAAEAGDGFGAVLGR